MMFYKYIFIYNLIDVFGRFQGIMVETGKKVCI